MDIGRIERIVKVSPEPFPLGHPTDAPHEPAPQREPLGVPGESPEYAVVPA